MGPEQTKLLDRLFGDPSRQVRNFKFTAGDGNPTPEQLCGEINKALDEVERRRALGLPDDGAPRSGLPQRTIGEVVADLNRANT